MNWFRLLYSFEASLEREMKIINGFSPRMNEVLSVADMYRKTLFRDRQMVVRMLYGLEDTQRNALFAVDEEVYDCFHRTISRGIAGMDEMLELAKPLTEASRERKRMFMDRRKVAFRRKAECMEQANRGVRRGRRRVWGGVRVRYPSHFRKASLRPFDRDLKRWQKMYRPVHYESVRSVLQAVNKLRYHAESHLSLSDERKVIRQIAGGWTHAGIRSVSDMTVEVLYLYKDGVDAVADFEAKKTDIARRTYMSMIGMLTTT